MERLPSRILIVGASTRAAAQSAVRAGISPVCVTRYADEDLRAVADVLPCDESAHTVCRLAQAVPGCPWMYTGAIENRPRLVAKLSASRPLLGNSAAVLRAVRDPHHVGRVLRQAGLPALAVRSASDAPPPDGRWLLKLLRSSGGEGIHVWDREFASQRVRIGRSYFQARSAGEPWSALFVADSRTAWLIGMSRQLVGVPESNATRFAYCGTVGPLPPESRSEERIRSVIRRIGIVLTQQFRLSGLFGCDFMCDGDTAWLTEVNPRYTASVEVYEYAYREPLLSWHCAAAAGDSDRSGRAVFESPTSIDAAELTERRPHGLVGKQIVYAKSDLTTPALDPLVARNNEGSAPFIADVPSAGTRIAAGQPVCTVFATGDSIGRCMGELAARVHEVSEFLWPQVSTDFWSQDS